MGFESKEEATQQHNLEKVQGKKRKSPVDKFDKMEWDKEARKAEIMSYGDGTLVNCSEYGIKNISGGSAKNGGQIVFEWLKSE